MTLELICSKRDCGYEFSTEFPRRCRTIPDECKNCGSLLVEAS